MRKEWKNFNNGLWTENINVEDFIVNNYTEYTGTEEFLKPISIKTKKVWDKCLTLIDEELKTGVLDVEVDTVSGINN